MNQTILEQNLTALSLRNPTLVDRLRGLDSEAAESLEFSPSKQGVLTARYRGTALASKFRPLDEARRLAEDFDPVANSVAVVLGFGLGYHIRALCERLAGTGLVLVFEPDLRLLHAVLARIDAASWLRENDVFVFCGADCQPEINARLDKLLAIVAQGAAIIAHAPSRARLGEEAGVFSKSFAEALAAMRTTLTTTLVHSVTTCRNLCLNVDQYGLGAALLPLKNWAAGHGAILVAAGPSLVRNVALLEDPAVRERVVIIAVQTALKPLLARGIRPHFVTAIDYHEISKQFYEGLTAADVAGITLICEPKANRAILEAFPGAIRCVGNQFLSQLLGPLARDMGDLKAGATVAHLNFVLAQYLGCDPIAFVGQDLGFTDGLYYGPGAAIHEQWAPELNRFNTIEMMEWQRVARMRTHLRQMEDQIGRPILVDEQMATYLKLFEAEFAAAPQRIIDATEGGTCKRFTEILPLSAVLAEMQKCPRLPELPTLDTDSDPNRATHSTPSHKELRSRLRSVRQRVVRLGDISVKTATLLDRMLDDQADNRKMSAHFDRMDKYLAEVDALREIMELVGAINQLGIFNRLKADRALKLASELDEFTKQTRQIERDKTNVVWIGDACREFTRMLDESERVLTGQHVDPRISHRITDCAETLGTELATDRPDTPADTRHKIAAIIVVDPERNGLLIPRRLDESFLNRSVLQCTLERLNQCQTFDKIILLTPAGFDVGALLDLKRITTKQVVVRECDTPLFDEAHSAVAAGRRWSDSCWRGGIGGLTIFDEIMSPGATLAAMEAEALEAVLVVGPDWPLVDPSGETGCDALVTRYFEHPDKHSIVFSQAPPGLVGGVISSAMMADLAKRTRRNSVGALLTYIPDVPQRDPATMELCVKLPAAIRNRAERLTFDTHARRARIRAAFAGLEATDVLDLNTDEIFAALDQTDSFATLPQQVEIEICTQRTIEMPGESAAAQSTRHTPMSESLIDKIVQELAERDDVTITLGGSGDPLLHPQFSEIVKLVRQHGIMGLHVQTDLLDFADAQTNLLQLPIDVISVNLNADRAATYARTMQADRFPEIISKLENLINGRHEQAGCSDGLTLPWIVPTFSRRPANLVDLQAFFDRWSYFLNAAVIAPETPASTTLVNDGSELPPLIHVPIPPAARKRMDENEMLIRADGSVPVDSDDRSGTTCMGNINEESIAIIWQRLLAARRTCRPALHLHKSKDQVDRTQTTNRAVSLKPELMTSQ